MSNPSVLITGINGFVGHHAAQAFFSSGCNVYGLGLNKKPGLDIQQYIEDYYTCNLTNKDQVNTVPWAQFDHVINLAGLADVGRSYDEPRRYMSTHNDMVILLCEALLSQKHAPSLLFVSSGAVYQAQNEPIAETSPIQAKSPYAVSKLSSELVIDYYRSRGLRATIVRPFNHFGPGQDTGFVVADLASEIARVEKKGGGEIRVGNLASGRDFTDVRDVVNAYVHLALDNNLNHTLYNVCTGKARTIREVLDGLIKLSACPNEIRYSTAKNKLRLNDDDIITGSSDRLKTDTRWEPTHPFQKTLSDTLNYWRQRV